MEKTPTISQVREWIRPHLARLVNDSSLQIGQSFLVAKNQFFGVHFTLGPYSAVWKFAETAVVITCEGQPVLTLPVLSQDVVHASGEPLRRAA